MRTWHPDQTECESTPIQPNRNMQRQKLIYESDTSDCIHIYMQNILIYINNIGIRSKYLFSPCPEKAMLLIFYFIIFVMLFYESYSITNAKKSVPYI